MEKAVEYLRKKVLPLPPKEPIKTPARE